MAAEYADDPVPQAGLVKGELFMYDEVKNKTHAHSHKVAYGACGAEFFPGEGDGHFFSADKVHEQADGVISAINGDASGNHNGDEVFYDLAGGFPGVPGIKCQEFGEVETYGDGDQVTHPEGFDVIPV